MNSKEERLSDKLKKLETKREQKEKLAKLRTEIAGEKKKIKDLTPHRKFDKEKWNQIKTNAKKVAEGIGKIGSTMQPYAERLNKKVEDTL